VRACAVRAVRACAVRAVRACACTIAVRARRDDKGVQSVSEGGLLQQLPKHALWVAGHNPLHGGEESVGSSVAYLIDVGERQCGRVAMWASGKVRASVRERGQG
jgi:hypothetical protein